MDGQDNKKPFDYYNCENSKKKHLDYYLAYLIGETVANENYESAKRIQPVGNVKITKISYDF